MNFLIIGYGKMGKEIEKQILAQNFNVAAIIDKAQDWNNIPQNIDVAIEFTTPDTAAENLIKCFKLGIPVVCGTTAWHHKLDIVENACKEENATLLYGSNFSIGMNIFFELNKHLVKIMNNFSEYKPAIIESHHIHKLDKPSGTAISLANDIITLNNEVESWKIDNGELPSNILPITSVRVGEVKGNHTVKFESKYDIISIQHEAKSRCAFAEGAIMAATWVKDKKGVYNFSDYFKQFIK